jgi:serine/threonine protein phosphatase 1
MAANTSGRDFVVGDLHGNYNKLMRKMDKANFDPARDRVFSVGDLVNRGDSSFRCLSLIKDHWFFAVGGNHERILVENYDAFMAGDSAAAAYLGKVGAHWVMDDPELYAETCSLIDQLPLAIQVGDCNSPASFGIAHACTPRESDSGKSRPWSWLSDVLQIPDRADSHDAAIAAPILSAVADQILWDRSLIKAYLENPDCHQVGQLATIDGIGRVFHGHSVLPKPTQVGNRFYIDTGAGRPGGRLTFMELQGGGYEC